jgi:hypothetical protein
MKLSNYAAAKVCKIIVTTNYSEVFCAGTGKSIFENLSNVERK